MEPIPALILVDSNIPMYLVGHDPARKLDVQRSLDQLLVKGERLVSDAEVLQEILHRYISIKRLEAIQPAFDALLEIVDEVLSIDRKIVERAKEISLGYRGVSARDAVHLAVMQQHAIGQILSFDSGFDGLPGITRLC